MTINSQNTSINSKDPAQDAQNISRDVQHSTAMTETPQPTESTDLSPQGLPSADVEPLVPGSPTASEVAESSGSGAPQEMPIADAGQKTPPTEYVCPQAEDTPARPRTSHSNRFRNGNLGERREIVVQDIHHVDIIDVDFFFSNLLPSPPETVSNCLDAVMNDLKEEGRLSGTDGQSTWKAFSEKMKEDAYFAPFEEIFKAVVSSTEKHSGDPNLKATHSFKMEPNKVPTSDRAEQMRPDACFVLKPSKAVAGKRTSWFDIACVGEFKTEEKREDVKDNIDKVIYGMHYIMANDPCRRFVTGFTVEKDTMALWFASRSALYKCVFDFKKEPKKLIRLFMAFAFANANGQETGWDPTVEPFFDIKRKRQYVYSVGDKKYVTKKLLVEYAADSLFGRATRVFLVTEEGKDEEHVLKDYWIDEGRSFELSIVEEMLRHVKDCCGEDAVDLVRRHIVTIMEEVDVEVGDEVDHTVNVMMRGTVPKINQEEDLMSVKDEGKGGYRSEGLHSLDGYGRIAYMILNGTQTRRKTLRKMRHRRVVYQEYGTPIDKVKRLSVAITVLQGVTEALKYIHKAEWVHRDISAGNIYEYGGRGLLADFEYAKKMGTEAAHEVKTGTLYFMAFEAILRAYNYHGTRRKPSAQFFHNVVHDMESVHWVLFFILKDVDCKDEKAAQEARVLIVYKLFTGEISSGEARQWFISAPSDTILAYGTLLGDDGKEIYDKVSELGEVLNRYYRAAEADLPYGDVDVTKFSGIHDEFMTIWKGCEGDLAKRDIHLDFKPVVIESSVLKRSAEKELPRKSKKSRTHEPIPEEEEVAVERK